MIQKKILKKALELVARGVLEGLARANKAMEEAPPEPKEIDEEELLKEGFAVIPVSEHMVRAEVARQIEAAFAATVWREREDEDIEVIVYRVFPAHIGEANTYLCMVGVGRKELTMEEAVIPLHAFLQTFSPVNNISFEEYQA